MEDKAALSEIDRLRLWFKTPVSKLSGDDAFVVLMVSMSLFERYAKAVLSEQQIKATPEEFRRQSAKILDLEQDVFDKFWGMFRDGLQHCLQPKVFETGGTRYRWKIDSAYGERPRFETSENTIYVTIDPWKWFDLVFSFWEKRPDLLSRLTDYPLGTIF